MNAEEKKAFIERRRRSPSSESRSDDDRWSDESSGSYYSDSDSYVPEWDSFVRDDGELVYIVNKTESERADASGLLAKSEGNSGVLERGKFTRQSVRRSSKGMWLKILKRRNSSRSFSKNESTALDNLNNQLKKQSLQSTDNKVTFSENQKGEIKEVSMEVDFSIRSRMGRKNNQMESIFGILTSTFGDGKRLMVSGIIQDAPAGNQKQIKIGDWLKEIDNNSVTADNLEQILNSYPENTVQVKLALQRIVGTEVKPDESANEHNFHADLTEHLSNEQNEHEIVLMQVLRDSPVSVVYLKTEGLTENGPENEGVLYCYPRPEKFNFLCYSRGTFITLNHLIPDVLKNSKPTSCSVIVKDCLVNIIYTSRNGELLLFALPDKKCSLFELSHINAEVVSVLEFCYKSLHDCFVNSSNTKKVDHLFSRLFSQILTCGYGWDSQKSTRIENILLSSDIPTEPLFEQCLPIIQTVHLPWEARLQVDDALTELEATYISRSNQDVEMQDVFHIIGSCVYYSGHLLTSHLLQSDLMAVHSFLRLQGFLSISNVGNVKNLIVWKEVYFNEAAKFENDSQISSNAFINQIPNYRTYIVINGKGNFLLATILRGTQTIKNVPPSPYFVEECESTIDLLVEVGLDNFLNQWFKSNLQPQVMLHPEDFLSSHKIKDHTGKKSSPILKKSAEIQSILKKRNQSEINNSFNIDSQLNNSNSSHSQSSISGITSTGKSSEQTYKMNSVYGESDDSYSENSASEVSEERIQGRRAIRDKENRQRRNSLSSDSYTEWDVCEANSQISGSYELADLSQSLMQKIEVLLPTKVTAGNKNVCFHFVRLENELGVLLAPTVNVQKNSDSELYQHILKRFRKTSQKIHTLLQNTTRYKRMLSPSSSVNKSLVAIKEYGILFKVPAKTIEDMLVLKKNEETFSYWVIGRLFEHPKFTEVYVCCHESVPQNMVEIAFRLAFVT